ncbi:MAG: YbbR-like domain-containing protein [Alkaliphilus sp.]
MSNFFARNATAKIISILFALVMWIYVMGEINPIITIEITNVPINIISEELIRERGLVIRNVEIGTVNARLTGRLDYVTNITRDKIILTADLLDLGVGRNNVPIIDNISSDIEVKLSSETLMVDLEEIIRVQKEIALEISGEPKENHVLGASVFTPTVAWIEGPESYVGRVHAVIARLEVENMLTNITATLPLKAYDIRGVEISGVDIQTDNVEVSLLIDSQKTVRIIPNIEAKAADGFEITKTTATPNEIVIIGQPEVLSDIFTIQTRLVEREGLNTDVELIVTLILPTNVYTNADENTKIRIEVEKIEEKIIAVPREKIVFFNLEEDLQIDKSGVPEKIEIKVVALENFIGTLDADDFSIIVNLEELGVGEYTIEPTIKTSFFIEQGAKEIELITEGFEIIIESVSEQ